MTKLFGRASLTSGLTYAATGFAAADPVGGDGYHHHMWGDGFGFFGGGLMLISWIAIILLIVFAVKWLMDREGPKSAQSSALDALKMRFAKGEIDAEEYEARRKILES